MNYQDSAGGHAVSGPHSACPVTSRSFVLNRLLACRLWCLRPGVTYPDIWVNGTAEYTSPSSAGATHVAPARYRSRASDSSNGENTR